MRDFKAFLQLIRFPGVFTAHADILAGALIAGAGLRQLPGMVWLLMATTCLYSAGMALNDYFDRRIDRLERPARPIPSGRVSERVALYSGVGLLAAGALCASFANAAGFAIALLLAGAILSYDGGMKQIRWVGPFNMGFCRYLNLLLGISILPLSSGSLAIPVLTGLYIFGITVLSSSEVHGRDPGTVTVCLASIVGVAGLFWIFGALGVLPGKWGLHFCLAWMLTALSLSARLFFKTSPGHYQQTIKWLLLLLVVLDTAIVAGGRSAIAGLMVFPLLFPGGYVAKRFYVT